VGLMDKKIISEQDVRLYGRDYKEITYEDGEKVLRRYDKKEKIWITLRFEKEHNQKVVDDIIECIVNNL